MSRGKIDSQAGLPVTYETPANYNTTVLEYYTAFNYPELGGLVPGFVDVVLSGCERREAPELRGNCWETFSDLGCAW